MKRNRVYIELHLRVIAQYSSSFMFVILQLYSSGHVTGLDPVLVGWVGWNVVSVF